MPRTYPNSLLKIYGASTASPCQKCTSLYTFGSEFRLCRNIASDITSGIRAAADNPQRISTATDGGGFTQKRDLRNANLGGKKCTWKYISYRACGTFLPISLYLHRLFAKGLRKVFSKTVGRYLVIGDAALTVRCRSSHGEATRFMSETTRKQRAALSNQSLLLASLRSTY